MKHPLIFGLQYGDEGKGKITDYLAQQADIVLRFNGGNNAGHSLWLNGKKVVTHSVPSGVMYSHTRNFIGSGCVVDPIAIKKELEELASQGAGVGPDRFQIDFRAHITLPIHLALDSSREQGARGIGTTKRGIGPTYSTKADRTGIRAGDLLSDVAEDRVRFLCETYNSLLKHAGFLESSVEDNLKAFREAREFLRPYVSTELNPFFELAKTKKILLEGAQSILLDIDHGAYPFVTSSNTLPAYAAIGGPMPLSKIGNTIGVLKAYVTRVGAGPFVTELNDETGERIRRKGAEFGATTGRPRRVGWLNLDEVKAAADLADCSALALTKSDILSGEEKVGVYSNGKLEFLPGWTDIKQGEVLHPNFKKFLDLIETVVGRKIWVVGTGSDREALYWHHTAKDFWNSNVSGSAL